MKQNFEDYLSNTESKKYLTDRLSDAESVWPEYKQRVCDRLKEFSDQERAEYESACLAYCLNFFYTFKNVPKFLEGV